MIFYPLNVYLSQTIVGRGKQCFEPKLTDLVNCNALLVTEADVNNHIGQKRGKKFRTKNTNIINPELCKLVLRFPISRCYCGAPLFQV